MTLGVKCAKAPIKDHYAGTRACTDRLAVWLGISLCHSVPGLYRHRSKDGRREDGREGEVKGRREGEMVKAGRARPNTIERAGERKNLTEEKREREREGEGGGEMEAIEGLRKARKWHEGMKEGPYPSDPYFIRNRVRRVEQGLCTSAPMKHGSGGWSRGSIPPHHFLPVRSPPVASISLPPLPLLRGFLVLNAGTVSVC